MAEPESVDRMLDELLKGKKPDFAIEPNDIIFIPGSSVKTLAYGLLGVIPSVTQGASMIR